MLVLRRHPEIGEDEDENEDVIDAERVLDQVAGKKIDPLVGSLPAPDDGVKAERERDPERLRRTALGRLMRVRPAEAEEIDGQRRENSEMKCDPKPDADRHEALGFHG